MSWTLAHNLQVRRDACKGCYPGVVVGEIGDQAHASESGGSDHNPDSRGIVHAIDVMLSVGPKATAVVNWCLAHPDDLEYVIHNRLIYTVASHWKPLVYHGTDPHTNHVHISGLHGTVGKNAATGTGYNTAAEHMTPTGSPCATISNPSAPVAPEEPVTKEDMQTLITMLLSTPLGRSTTTVGQALQHAAGAMTQGEKLGTSGPTVGIALQDTYNNTKPAPAAG